MESKRSNIVVGVFFVIAAIAMILSPLKIIPYISMFDLFLTILIGGLFIGGIIKRNFGEVIFAIAFAMILFSKELGLEAITPWPVLLSAFLLTIGVEKIFPKKYSYRKYAHKGNKLRSESDAELKEIIDIPDESYIEISNAFSGVAKYVNCDNFEGGYIQNSFGGVAIYLEKVKFAGKEAKLNFELNCSGVELHVARDVTVLSDISIIVGGIEEKNTILKNPNPDKVLRLYGSARLSGITVIYEDTKGKDED